MGSTPAAGQGKHWALCRSAAGPGSEERGSKYIDNEKIVVINTHTSYIISIRMYIWICLYNIIAEEKDTNISIAPCYLVSSSTLGRTPGRTWAGVVRPIEP